MSLSRANRMQAYAWTATACALLGLLWLLGPMLSPFIIGAVLAYICNPLVGWLSRHRLPRTAAVLLVIVGLGLLIATLALILLPMVYRQGNLLLARLPEVVELFNTHWRPLLEQQFGLSIDFDVNQLRRLIAEHWSSAQELLPVLFSHLKSGGSAAIAFLSTTLLVPLVMFYLLREWPQLLAGLQGIVPRPWLGRTMDILAKLDSVLSEFLRGQLAVMLLLALFYSLGLKLAGLDFWLPVGVLTGLLIFIPFVGFGSGLVLAVLAALLQGEGWSLLLGVGIVYGIGQVLESFGLTPYLVGERIGLHPLAVVFALLAFGELFGFVGVLIALPAGAAMLVGLRELRAAWFASPIYLGDEAEGLAVRSSATTPATTSATAPTTAPTTTPTGSGDRSGTNAALAGESEA